MFWLNLQTSSVMHLNTNSRCLYRGPQGNDVSRYFSWHDIGLQCKVSAVAFYSFYRSLKAKNYLHKFSTFSHAPTTLNGLLKLNCILHILLKTVFKVESETSKMGSLWGPRRGVEVWGGGGGARQKQ